MMKKSYAEISTQFGSDKPVIPLRTIVVCGRQPAETVSLILYVLGGQSGFRLHAIEGVEWEKVAFQPEILVVLDMPDIRRGKRILRCLPHRRGLVVAQGRDVNIRKACKGFAYRFRWFDDLHPWPGLAAGNARSAAARVAHELGISQLTIKEKLRS
jgi:hypothetical protein